MGCLSFENTRKFLFQLWFLFYRFRYLRRRNSYVTFFRESLSLYRWVVFWFSIFNKNNEEGVLRFLWNITENNKTFLHLDRSPYFRERTIRPHLGTKISSKKLSAGRRGWVDDRAKKGKASSPTLVPFPPPPSTPRTCSQAKLLHPYSNSASLIADFSRIFTTLFLYHCYRFWTNHWKRKEPCVVMCYSQTRSFKLAPLPSPWNKSLTDKSKYFISTAGLFRVSTVLSWGWENFGPP